MPPHPHTENYSPLALIATLLFALLLFALFFIGFLVAPLAILVIFYIFFAASDRSKRASGTGFVAEEPEPVVEQRTVVVEERRQVPAAERAAYEAGLADRQQPPDAYNGGRFERHPVGVVPETADERLAREAAARRGQA